MFPAIVSNQASRCQALRADPSRPLPGPGSPDVTDIFPQRVTGRGRRRPAPAAPSRGTAGPGQHPDGSSLRSIYARSCAQTRAMEHYRAVIKVTFVGAGSIEFTRNVVTDLCSYPEFRGGLHLALYDISARAAGPRRAAGPADRRADGRRRDGERDPGPARGARRRPLRDQRGAGRRLRRDPGRLRHPGPVRGAPDDRRHPGHRRDLPRPADHPGDHRAGPGHARRVPGRVPAQLQQPDGHAALVGVRGHAVHQGVRAVPLGPGHAGLPDRPGRRGPGPGPVPDRGIQPPGVRAPVRAGRPVPVPAAGRGHRRLTRAAAAGPGGDLPPVRLLPDRVQRALRRVRAVVHAPRRPDRAVPHLRRRLPGPVRGEPPRAGVAAAGPGLGRAAGPGADPRARVAVHPLAGNRHRARAAREHPQRRADHEPAGRVLRRGALRGRGGRRPSRCRSARCRRSWPR